MSPDITFTEALHRLATMDTSAMENRISSFIHQFLVPRGQQEQPARTWQENADSLALILERIAKMTFGGKTE